MTDDLAAYLQSLDNALTASEVARLLRVTRDTVYVFAKYGGLPSINIGRTKPVLRFDPKQLAQWLRERQNDMQEQRSDGRGAGQKPEIMKCEEDH
jgi:excisionase family DNA binding protein